MLRSFRFIDIEQSIFHIDSFDPLIEESDQYIPNSLLLIEIYAAKEDLIHSRAVYNFLDFLGDIGGFIDALRFIAMMVISFTQMKKLPNIIAKHIFYTTNAN